jgi:hypothetical protein
MFQALCQARADVSQLTSAQVLRKDTKDLKFNGFGISMPAVPISAQVGTYILISVFQRDGTNDPV